MYRNQNPKTSSQRLEEKMEHLTNNWINDESLLEEQRKDLNKFFLKLDDDGLNARTRNGYASILVGYARWLKKPFKETNENDVRAYMRELARKSDSIYSWNNTLFKIRALYRWLYGLKKKENAPQLANIELRKKKNKRLPIDSFLTDEERKRFIGATDNIRDRALLMVLYDSGARISEVLDLRIKNISFDEYGSVILIHGKTGDRRIRLIESASDLQSWINHHPFKDNPEAPVWQLSRSDEPEGMTLSTIYSLFRKSKRKSGIKKRINPHLFRHMRASERAHILTEHEMNEEYGWVQGSGMPSIYVQMNGDEIDKKKLADAGLLDLKEEKKRKEHPPICPRCKSMVSPMDKFCSTCGMVLDVETAMELKNARDMLDERLASLLDDKDVKELLIQKLKEKMKKEG